MTASKAEEAAGAMSVEALQQAIERAYLGSRRPLRITIRINNPGALSGSHTVGAVSAQAGFDWEAGQLVLEPQGPLTMLKPEEVAAVMESVRKGTSWHAYKAQEALRRQNAALLSEREAKDLEIEKLRKDAERYRWLRDQPRKAYSKSRPMDAPWVVNPDQSKLYAMKAHRGEGLDMAVDEDILNDMAQHIYENAIAEGGPRFADPAFKFSDEFANECNEKARAALQQGDGK